MRHQGMTGMFCLKSACWYFGQGLIQALPNCT
jgi:hypothetical protein